MGTKRATSAEAEAEEAEEYNSEAEGVDEQQEESNDRQAAHTVAHKGKKKHKAREGTVNWTKKRARDIERLLQKSEKLPATRQNELERELASLQKRLSDEREKKHRNMMIKKYHMVRFFERKKAQRLEKQLRTQLDQTTDPSERAAIEKDIHIAQVDVHYAKYFPFMERYVSLYTKVADSKADETARAKVALHSERPPLWATVEKAMTRGEAALRLLQNRRLGVDSRAKPPPERPSRHSFAARAKGLHERGGRPPKSTPSGKESASRSKHSSTGNGKAISEAASLGDAGGFFSLQAEDS